MRRSNEFGFEFFVGRRRRGLDMEHNDEPPASDARAAEPDDLLLRVLRRHWGYDSFRPGQRRRPARPTSGVAHSRPPLPHPGEWVVSREIQCALKNGK